MQSKKVAGSSYVNFVRTSSQVFFPQGLLENPIGGVVCTPSFSTSSCVGNCRTASFTVTQVPNANGAICQNYLSITSCKERFKCECRFMDLVKSYTVLDNVGHPLQWGGALPCGNCDVVSGEWCRFVCANGNTFSAIDSNGQTQSVGGFSSISCTDDGWPDFTGIRSAFLPNCAIRPPRCPNVLGMQLLPTGGRDMGFSPQPRSNCIDAKYGDSCTVACSPNYYSPQNQFTATCTSVTRNGKTTLDWLPWNKDRLDGHMNVCQCQGCRWGLTSNPSCPCQVSTYLAPYVCSEFIV